MGRDRKLKCLMIVAFRCRFVLSCTGLLACGLASAAVPAAAAPQASDTSLIRSQPMIFFVAKGEPNACGPGCSEWIAAEGAIDSDAPKRLRTFLTSLADRKLPIFFHSPGGLLPAALAIGRLLRGREMTAGVSRTVETELHNIAGCHSACVFALIGAKVRQVPPGARIGVHTGKINGFDFEGRYRAFWNEQVRRYLRDMGIADSLLEVISGVPHESAHYLSRDEIADFGIDTREFQETRWIAMEWPWVRMEWPPQPLSVLKFVVERKEQRKGYRTTVIRLSCGRPGGVGLGYFRRLMSDEVGGARSIELVADRSKLSLPKEPSISKLDAIESGGSFETRFTYDASAFLALAATRDSIDVIESGPTDAATSPRIIQLSTNGLSTALEQLNKTCRDREVLDAPGIRFLDPREAPPTKAIDVPGASSGR
jgi:hypothetical protein